MKSANPRNESGRALPDTFCPSTWETSNTSPRRAQTASLPQYIMEMRNHIISAVHRDIERRHRQNEYGKAAHRKDKDKADREQHGRLKTQRAAPHCRNPVEDFNAGRH